MSDRFTLRTGNSGSLVSRCDLGSFPQQNKAWLNDESSIPNLPRYICSPVIAMHILAPLVECSNGWNLEEPMNRIIITVALPLLLAGATGVIAAQQDQQEQSKPATQQTKSNETGPKAQQPKPEQN